ncbi:MAG: chemotaxis protein CheA [Desulfobacterales bacterium]|nr:chemotaxis protein CheA [Desulfobacterales bacterium]
MDYVIDPELLSGFVDESLDGISELDNLFISLESHPDNLDIVNSIFRPIHSIKGSSAFFGLLKVKELAHGMENLLDKIRNHRIKATKDVIAVLLPGLDLLKSMFHRLRTGIDEVDDKTQYQQILESIESMVQSEGKVGIQTISQDVIEKIKMIESILPADQKKLCTELIRLIEEQEMLVPSKKTELITEIEAVTTGIDPIIQIRELLDMKIDRELDAETSKQVGHELEALLEWSNSDETRMLVSELITDYRSFMQQIGFDSLLQDMILTKINQLEQQGNFQQPVLKPKETQSQEKVAEKEEGKSPSEQKDTKTMRVSEKNIDSFLSYVGELVVVEEMFTYIQKKLVSAFSNTGIVSEFKRVIETFRVLSDNLRESIMEIRTVPIKSILNKAPRIIHDISSQTGKQVEVIIQGDEMKVDKSYIELLDAPFTHLVRNAIDHGIETTEERIRAGKPPKGTISIVMQETEKDIELIVSEDGKGINYDAILHKAIQLGIVDSDHQLDESAIVDLIFMSGVSTAQQVTEISGRGVGMDVVKRNIDSVGGKISIQSTPGKGTTFKIALPKSVSTQIMDGFLVKAGGETYVMPMEIVGESFSPKVSDITIVAEKGEVVMRRGELFPVVRLAEALHNGKAHRITKVKPIEMFQNDIMISIKVKDFHFALSVDEIVGVQKIVVKPIEALILKKQLFDGAAMMGDGRVAMIIGSNGLKQIAGF